MNTVKICFFNSTRAWGGGEKWHFDVAVRLHNKHGNVLVIAGKGSELGKRLTETDIPHFIVSISNLSLLNVFKIIKLVRIFRKEKPDVLIMNLPADLKAAGIAARLSGVKRIIYRRGSAIAVKDSFLNRFLFKYIIDEIIANSEETARSILYENQALFPKEKIHVVYNGVDWEHFDSLQKSYVPKSRHSRVVLGNIGRLAPQKGQEILILIAKLLKNKGYNFEIAIAGDGKLKESLQQKSREEGVADHIQFLGFVDNVPQFLNSIDIFLLPSHWEGFGYVIAEAMYSEKPVVAFNVSSNPEIVNNNVTGFLVEHGNVELFLEKTEALINDIHLRQKMGKNGKVAAIERFSIQHTLTKIECLLYTKKFVNTGMSCSGLY